MLSRLEPRDLHVPASFATVQAAIDAAAQAGDRVVLAPGQYEGSVRIAGRRTITLVGGAARGAVRLHCAEDHTLEVSGVGTSVTLERLTIACGAVGEDRVAVWVTDAARLRMADCDVSSDAALAGVVVVERAELAMEGCYVHDCSASGVAVCEEVSARLEFCRGEEE